MPQLSDTERSTAVPNGGFVRASTMDSSNTK